jgi:hypothetical protein
MKKIFFISTLLFLCTIKVKSQELILTGEHYRLPEMPGDIFDSEYTEYSNKGIKISIQKNINITTRDTMVFVRFQDKMNRYIGFLDYEEIDNIIRAIDYIRFNKIFVKAPKNSRSMVYTRNAMAFGMAYYTNKANQWDTFVLFDWRKPDPVYLTTDDFSNISETLKKIRNENK